MPSCRHVPSLHLVSTLLNNDVIMKKKWSRVSHKTLTLSTDESQSRGRTSIDPKSSCWTPCILDIGSTTVHDASIGSAMVPIHVSQLIGQMRGTSHESQTIWVGCMLGHRQEKVNHSSCSYAIGEGEPLILCMSIVGEGEPLNLHTCVCNRRGRWTTHPTHMSTIKGYHRGRWTTYPTHMSTIKGYHRGKVNHSPCT